MNENEAPYTDPEALLQARVLKILKPCRAYWLDEQTLYMTLNLSRPYPNQELTTTFLLIGYIVAADSSLDGTVINGGPADAPVSGKIIQCVTTDLLLQNVVFNGLPAVFPFASHAPYST